MLFSKKPRLPEEVIKEPDENGPLIILAFYNFMCWLEEKATTESPEEVIKEPDENGPLIILAAFIILCVGAIVKQFCI